MKVRIYKLTSGEVIVDTPAKRYQSRINECPHPWRLRESNPDREDFEMELKDLSEIEQMAVNNEAGSGQFYYNGNQLKHDSEWKEILMSLDLLKQKQRKRLEENLNEELERLEPDPIRAMRLERQKKKVKDRSEREIYQDALDNLPPGKPKIKKLLKEKLEA